MRYVVLSILLVVMNMLLLTAPTLSVQEPLTTVSGTSGDVCSPSTNEPLCENGSGETVSAPCLLAPPTCQKNQRAKIGVCSKPTTSPCNYF